MRRASYCESVLIVLPGMWWALGAFSSALYVDPRFFRIYQVPLFLFAWVGGSFRPAEAVAIQDGVVALLASSGLAAIMIRWSAWHNAGRLRMAWAVLSVLLPWQPFLMTLNHPEWHTVAATTLAAGYAATSVGGFVAPVSRGMQTALFGLALAVGGTLAAWRLERSDWLLVGSLIAAFALLAYSLAASLLWDERRRRTRG